jgi:serine/threonine-protein kinase
MPLRGFAAGVAAWVLGAAIAVAVGMLALSLIDTGPAINSEPVAPQAEAQNLPVPPTQSPDPTPLATVASGRSAGASTSAAPTTTQRQITTVGGTVTARCTGAVVYLVSWSPTTGYRVGRVHRGPTDEATVAFVSSSATLTVEIHCAGGVPQGEASWGADN